MRRRTRRFMFVVAVIVFCATSYLAMRYAQGYVWDWTNQRFVRTGALSVSINTDGAQVFVDNKMIGSTSLLGRRVGENRLPPGTYNLRVVKDGWSSWYKSAAVTEGVLTDFPAVLLVATDDDALTQLRIEASRALGFAHTIAEAPKPPKGSQSQLEVNNILLRGGQLFDLSAVASSSPLASGVRGFAVTSDRRIVWWNANDVSLIWTRATDEQPFRSPGDRLVLAHWSTGVQRAAWFRDQDHVVVELANSTYRILETDTRGSINIIRF